MSKTLKEITTSADRLYDERHEPHRVRQSIELLRERPADYDALWRLSRAHFFLGQEATDKAQARSHHGDGVEAGEKAARALEVGVEGHFWLGVNLALLAGLEKHIRALLYAWRAKRELQHAVLINPSYHGAGPLRVLARLESRLPPLAGGGHKRAQAHFEEAIRLAPANTVTRLYYAELLMERGETNRARTELETILTIPLDPAWAFEIKRDRMRAREILGSQKAKVKKKEDT